MSSIIAALVGHHTLPEWPPKLSDEQIATLLLESSTYALGHGFTLLPPHPASGAPPAPTHAIAAPLSLFPSPFPREEYERAKSLQVAYNALYARVALDWAFLDRVMGQVAQVDEFQAELWFRWKSIRDDLVQEPLQLGIFRSDYLLDESSNGLAIKQVEFNTIAASFGALSQKAGEMHKFLARTTGAYFGSGGALADPSAYPDNHSLEEIAAGLAEGWSAYGNKDAAVLVVVQEGERNVFDQRGLQYELLKTHGVQSVRYTFAELGRLAKLDEKRRLVIPNPVAPESPPAEIAVVYYRAAYTPNDYPTSTEWDTRVLLERSMAIKCPTMALQLAGAKKVQQELANPGVVEGLLLGITRPDVGGGDLSQIDVDKLRETWTGLWPLDESHFGKEAQHLARSEPERFVLKPQREGGGNNIYRTDIPAYLDKLDAEPLKPGDPPKREAYILMEIIKPPTGLHNYLVRGGEGKARLADVVSELGVYGVSLFGGESKHNINRLAGTLLRTKGRESDEGGVAIGMLHGGMMLTTGISSIDSPILVD